MSDLVEKVEIHIVHTCEHFRPAAAFRKRGLLFLDTDAYRYCRDKHKYEHTGGHEPEICYKRCAS